MYQPYLIGLTIILFAFIAVQLIRMNIYVLKLGKTAELNQVKSKEETEWQFIKGLY